MKRLFVIPKFAHWQLRCNLIVLTWLLVFFLNGPASFLYAQQPDYQTTGHLYELPVWYKKLKERQTFPLSWTHAGGKDFESWKQIACAKVKECMMTVPPVVPFDAVVIAEEDRGTYVARKISFNVTGDSRVLSLMLIPKSAGNHPAVLLLHDHGAKFDIGKEKVIRSFGLSAVKKICR